MVKDRDMKVLFLTNYGTLYGANRCLIELMVWLKKKYNIIPIVLVTGNPGPLGEGCKNLGIQCLNHNFRNRTIESDVKYKGLRRITRFWMRYVDYIKVHSFLKKNNVTYDIVHTNSSILDMGVFLARWAKVPHVWHIREFLDVSYNLEIVYGSKRLKRYYEEADSVIAISDSVYKATRKLSPKIKLEKISDGINLTDAYAKTYFKEDKVNICMVGSIQPAKNQLDVIQAVKNVVESGIKDIRLYIVGDTFGEYYESLVGFVKENNLSDYITFVGYVADVSGYLENMDIGIIASDMEAFGRVTVEYMSNYMMVLGSNTGATPDFIDEKYLFDLHDISELSTVITEVTRNKNLIKEVGYSNRKVAEQYSSEKNADNIAKIYEHIII